MSDEPAAQGSDVDVFENEVGEEEGADNSWTGLPPAGLLSIERVDALLRSRRAKIITVIGERNGGKTTLVAEIYERFLRAPFANCLFCHSLSLLGFELKSFWSRAVSGAQQANTQRTSARDGLNFFHLALSQSDNRIDLLISERAGESYRAVRDNPSIAHDLIELAKADIIVLILDGARVAQGKERAEAFASVRNITQALRDSGVTACGTTIQLVTTKGDLLDGDDGAKARDALTKFEETFVATFSPSFREITVLRVAARDPTGRVPTATGLDLLLQSWMRSYPPVPVEAPPPPELHDEFDRLLIRKVG